MPDLVPADEGYGGMTWQEVKDFLDHIRETCMNDRQMWKERARGAETEAARLGRLEKRLTEIGWMCDHGQGHKQWSWSSSTVYDRPHCDECFQVYRLQQFDGSDG